MKKELIKNGHMTVQSVLNLGYVIQTQGRNIFHRCSEGKVLWRVCTVTPSVSKVKLCARQGHLA